VSPQLDYRYGSFGLQSEYVLSTVNVRPSATGKLAELQNKAWQVSAGYVLTGENSSYGGVVPDRDFSVSKGTWGAFEVVGRFSNLRIDDDAFPAFASPLTSVNEIDGLAVGFNWYLSKTVRFSVDYYQAKFGRAPGAPVTLPGNSILREQEQLLISRFQLSF
jgi:phosphate-selective porin OprO/OprP